MDTPAHISAIFHREEFDLVTAFVEPNKDFTDVSEQQYIDWCLRGINLQMKESGKKESTENCLKEIETKLMKNYPSLAKMYHEKPFLSLLSVKNNVNLKICNFRKGDKIWIEVWEAGTSKELAFQPMVHPKSIIHDTSAEPTQSQEGYPWWYVIKDYFTDFGFGNIVNTISIFRLAYRNTKGRVYYSRLFIPVNGGDYVKGRLQSYLNRVQKLSATFLPPSNLNGKKRSIKQKSSNQEDIQSNNKKHKTQRDATFAKQHILQTTTSSMSPCDTQPEESTFQIDNYFDHSPSILNQSADNLWDPSLPNSLRDYTKDVENSMSLKTDDFGELIERVLSPNFNPLPLLEELEKYHKL